ncbi:MAG: response regulator, partial [Candidatus Sedimenticola sp. 20ELBAFRAG]
MALDKTNPIVLVVDDSPDSLGMINTALNQAGYMVLVALNGQQALDIVAQIQPNVVLMDAVMPVMDGFECCRQMR